MALKDIDVKKLQEEKDKRQWREKVLEDIKEEVEGWVETEYYAIAEEIEGTMKKVLENHKDKLDDVFDEAIEKIRERIKDSELKVSESINTFFNKVITER